MKLRTKTLIGIGATIVALMALLYVPLRLILLNSFLRLETQSVQQDVQRALNALNDDLDALEGTARDYSVWDDTWEFMADRNERHTQVNYVDVTFIHNRLSLVELIDNGGNVVFGKALDLAARRQTELPPRFRAFSIHDPLLREKPDDAMIGIVLPAEGPFMIATFPIVKSSGEGPVRGTLIMGRALDAQEVSRLAQSTRMRLSLHRLDRPLEPEIAAVRSGLAVDKRGVRRLSEDSIAGYALLGDVFGEPALALRIEMPRSIWAQGKRGAAYLAVALLCAGLVFGLVIVMLLERMVLSRLARLGRRVGEIGDSGDLSARVDVAGRDELAELASDVNGMLGNLEKLNLLLKDEQEKSERLLLNILPATIAARLKKGEGSLADSYAQVSVLFADIVGFTSMAATLPPARVVEMLNEIFTLFDGLAERHGLEKIKTIGDAYMAVAGLPTPRDDHATALAAMALDMLAALDSYNARAGTSLSIRVGINSGPVVAGVIGAKKFIYDIWGDTVNVASRMESAGISGQVQITEATAALLGGGYVLHERGTIAIKGRGEMRTFMLAGRRELSHAAGSL